MEDINQTDNNNSLNNIPTDNSGDNLLKKLDPNPLSRAGDYQKPIVHQDPQESNFDTVLDTGKSLALDVGKGINSAYNWAKQNNITPSMMPIFGKEFQAIHDAKQSNEDTGSNSVDDWFNAKQGEIDVNNPNKLIYYPGKIGGSILEYAVGGEALGAIRASKFVAGAAETTAKEIVEGSLARSKSVQQAIDSPKDGMVRTVSNQTIAGLPIAWDSSLSFDKHGQVSTNVAEFAENTALNGVFSGILAGVGKTYSTLILKNSQVTNAGGIIKEVADKLKNESKVPKSNIKENTRIEDTEHYTKAENIVDDNKSNAVGNEELIDATFTKEQKKQISNDVLGKKRTTGERYSDIRLDDDAAVQYHKMMTDNSLDDITKKKLTHAILSKYGILHGENRISLDDALATTPMTDEMKQVDNFYKESGARKVLLTDDYRKLPINKKADELAKGLFNTNSYPNMGAIKYLEKHKFYLDEPYKGGSEILHHYPNWYMQHKGGVEDPKLLKELDSMVASGSKHGAYLKALLEASHKDHVDSNRQGLYKSIRSTIDNHMDAEESNRILDDYHNNTGMFGARDFTENEKELTDMVNKSIDDNTHKFYDDDNQNVFFTKAIKKIRDNPKSAESYFLCMIGSMK